MIIEFGKTLKRELSQFLFHKNSLDEIEKEINYRSPDALFKYFIEHENSKVAQRYFHV
jgi:hypothetical protein